MKKNEKHTLELSLKGFILSIVIMALALYGLIAIIRDIFF